MGAMKDKLIDIMEAHELFSNVFQNTWDVNSSYRVTKQQYPEITIDDLLMYEINYVQH